MPTTHPPTRPPQVHFIIASCENMVDARGLRPGDILVASNGKVGAQGRAARGCQPCILEQGRVRLPAVHVLPGTGPAGAGACMKTWWLPPARRGASRRWAQLAGSWPACAPACHTTAHRLGLPTPPPHHHPSQTVEVNNTDAEGRLTLADAMLYAQEHAGAGERLG